MKEKICKGIQELKIFGNSSVWSIHPKEYIENLLFKFIVRKMQHQIISRLYYVLKLCFMQAFCFKIKCFVLGTTYYMQTPP